MDESDLKVLELDRQKQAERATVIKIALEALSHRLLTLVAMLLSAVATFWCMLQPDYVRVVTTLLLPPLLLLLLVLLLVFEFCLVLNAALLAHGWF